MPAGRNRMPSGAGSIKTNSTSPRLHREIALRAQLTDMDNGGRPEYRERDCRCGWRLHARRPLVVVIRWRCGRRTRGVPVARHFAATGAKGPGWLERAPEAGRAHGDDSHRVRTNRCKNRRRPTAYMRPQVPDICANGPKGPAEPSITQPANANATTITPKDLVSNAPSRASGHSVLAGALTGSRRSAPGLRGSTVST